MFPRIATADSKADPLSAYLAQHSPHLLGEAQLGEVCSQAESWHDQLLVCIQREIHTLQRKLRWVCATFPAGIVTAVLYSVHAGKFDGASLLFTQLGFVSGILGARYAFRWAMLRRLRYWLSPLEWDEEQDLRYYEGVCPEVAHRERLRSSRRPCKADWIQARALYERWREAAAQS